MSVKAGETEVSKLLAEIEVSERKLKQALKTPQPDEKEVKALRTMLMMRCERLLIQDYECASKNQVEQNLWKVVFYKRIEEFRKRHGKTSALLGDPDKKDRAQQALSHITTAFARFLSKASSFYSSLLRKLLEACNVQLEGYSAPVGDDGLSFVRCDEAIPRHRERKKAMLLSCERCLIFLGDLERYRSLYLEKESARGWTEAERHYSTASLLTPHVGNPHNQLAVIATYRGDDLEGMFHYARAILAGHPFATARENLLLLLDKNRQRLQAFLSSAPHQPARISLEEQARRRREEAELRFVRLHGMLVGQRELEGYAVEEGQALVRLVAALDADDMPPRTLLWMAAVCLFSVHDLADRAAQPAPLPHVHAAAPEPVRVAHQLAAGLALKLLGRLAVSARGRPEHLQAVATLCGWLHFAPHMLSSPPDADGSGQLRREVQGAAASLVDLLNLRAPRGGGGGAGGREAWSAVVLPEDKALAAFAPLAGALEGLEAAAREGRLGQVAAEQGEERLAALRLRRVEALARLMASGGSPMVYLDSQSGAYSVESPGTSQHSLGPVSQDRLPPPPSTPSSAPAPPPPRERPAHPSLLQESAPGRQGLGAGLGCDGVGESGVCNTELERGTASTNEVQGGGEDGLTVQEIAMKAAMREVEEGDAAGMDVEALAGSGIGEQTIEAAAAAAEEEENNDETFGDEMMEVAAAGAEADGGLGSLARQTAAFAACVPAGEAFGLPAAQRTWGWAAGMGKGEDEEMGFDVEEMVKSAIGSPGQAASGGGPQEEVFLTRAAAPAPLSPPAFSLGGAHHPGAGEGRGDSGSHRPAAGEAAGRAGGALFATGGLGGFGAGPSGYGSGEGGGCWLARGAGATATEGPGMLRGSLMPPSAFGMPAGGRRDAGRGQGSAVGSGACGGAPFDASPGQGRFTTRNPFA